MELILACAIPGANLVDLFPSLDRLPDILAPWCRAAVAQRELTQRVFKGLLEGMWGKLARGEPLPTVCLQRGCGGTGSGSRSMNWT